MVQPYDREQQVVAIASAEEGPQEPNPTCAHAQRVMMAFRHGR
jgi:hypothetical protein